MRRVRLEAATPSSRRSERRIVREVISPLGRLLQPGDPLGDAVYAQNAASLRRRTGRCASGGSASSRDEHHRSAARSASRYQQAVLPPRRSPPSTAAHLSVCRILYMHPSRLPCVEHIAISARWRACWFRPRVSTGYHIW